MEKIKYGIISTASIVPRFINAVRTGGKGEIVAIASRDIEKAKNTATEFNIPKAYGNYHELYQDEEINVVYIATINTKHYENCMEALKNNKNVICEKPFTMTKDEANKLFDYAEEKNLFIIEAQKVVFLPVINEIKKIIKSGKLGKIHLLDFTSSAAASYNTWLTSKKAGGGTLYGNASYFIQLIKYVLEEDIVNYAGMSIIAPEGSDSQCLLSLKLSNDILVSSKISYKVEAVNKAMIYGEKGYIEIPDYWKARTAKIYLHSGEVIDLDYPCKYELSYEVKHIEDCLNNNLKQSPIMNRDMTVSTIEILENIQNNWM